MAARAGHATLSPYVAVRRAEDVLAFARAVLGATEIEPAMRDGSGVLLHVSLRIGDSTLMLGTSSEGSPERTAMLHVYVDDCDATHARALEAGCREVAAPADQPYGDRRSGVEDAAGNLWWLATAG